MRMQEFHGITKKGKNSLVKFAKTFGYDYTVKQDGRKYDVTVYCSSEAMAERMIR